MQVTELNNNKTEYQAKITIPEKEVLELINKELVTIAKTAKMDGFRVGKVPAGVLKKKYSPSIRLDIARNQINNAIDETIKKNNLNIALDPIIEALTNEEGKDLEFTLKFELLPEITMPDFKKISIEQAKLEVSQKDIDDQIDRLSSFSKSYDEESKGKAKSGDQVTIDAIGYVDGKAFDGGKLDTHKLVLGSNAFIPGFEDQLIGCKAGDDVMVKVDFPKEYHAENLAGKPSEFKVQVKAVHKEKPVIIDDEFAKKFKCDTVDKLKEQITKNIEASYEEPIHTMMKMKLFDKLENMLKFDIPASLLARETEILKKQTAQMDQGDSAKENKDDYFDNLAKRRVKIGLMLAEYVKKNTLQIQEDDIRQAIIAQARNYPGQEQQVIEFYQKDRSALESLKGPILEEKAVKEIFSKEIILTTKAYSKDKLEKLLDKEIRD
ncbi:MAG: trigger factor [Rickettsiaceae bacterium]|nr:trigger factor [Rickettsiaceae bacterium]MDP5020734.1 trigger factor [Rickettsiaceae bacterium]MDP5083457.1 trigger factor [Rickettsiaceae bacterium]